jgi:uridine phosphorylase
MVKRRVSAGFALVAMLFCSCKSPRILDLYYEESTQRLDDASGYISFLKQTRFAHGELEHMPRYGIIFYGDVQQYLTRLGYAEGNLTLLKLGTADPTVLVVVHGPGTPFMIEQGLPGAGGITTQAAELVALGASTLLHVGTCGALGESVVKVFNGEASFKDGAAILLSPGAGRRVPRAEPDSLTRTALAGILCSLNLAWTNGTGFTMPVFYLQPQQIYKQALLKRSSPFRSDYVEMEQAAFFEMAKLLRVRAGSLVVTSDRLFLKNNELKHDYVNQDQVQQGLEQALRASIMFFEKFEQDVNHH